MSARMKVTFGAAVLAALAAACAAMATTRGANGLIVFAQELSPEHYQLFTIRPDGTGAKQITHVGVRNAGSPDWSPDGSTIVAEIETGKSAGISLMSADGSHTRLLTPKGEQGQPSFSPRRNDRLRA